MIVHCKKCGKAISGRTFKSRMEKLRKHYVSRHGGWKKPITKDHRYKKSAESDAKTHFCPYCGHELSNPCETV